MTKFAAFEKISRLSTPAWISPRLSDGAQTGVNLGSGVPLLVYAAAIVSPATRTLLLSKINKTKAPARQGTASLALPRDLFSW